MSRRRELEGAINDRLHNYGYSKDTTPRKYTKYCNVRGVIALQVPLTSGNKEISEEDYQAALECLDRILPKKQSRSWQR